MNLGGTHLWRESKWVMYYGNNSIGSTLSTKFTKQIAIECQQNSIKFNCNMEFASRSFFQFQTTFKLAFNRPKSLQVTEVRCPKKIHSRANSTFIFKLLKDFVSIGKARQESKVFALFRFPFHNWWKFRAKVPRWCTIGRRRRRPSNVCHARVGIWMTSFT